MNATVLTIDDDPAITELLSLILRAHNFEVLTANNSEVGLKLINDRMPDVVIVDFLMPDMDGREMCRRIRAFSKIPIVVLSALNDPKVVAAVLDSGADDYIVKPVPSSVLVAHLNGLVRRTTGNLRPEEANWLPGPAALPS